MNDIKIGVDRIRKLKFEHAKNKTELGKVKYSLQNPPLVFVRKALESSDSEGEGTNGVTTSNGKHRRYKMNHNRPRKPRLMND